MRIIFIYNDSFPNGGAEANRFITLCKGLKEEGYAPEVIIIRPTEKKTDSKNRIEGQIDGFSFKYMVKDNIWEGRSKFQKVYGIFSGYINSILYLHKVYRSGQKLIVVDNLTSLWMSFGYYIFGFIYNIKILVHLDEFPWPYIFPHKYNKIYKFIFYRIKYKLYNGLIVMTFALRDYYSGLKRRKVPMLHVPMTVDAERFKNENPGNRTYLITYCGSMSIYKDGIDILIQSFAIFIKKHPDYRLQLIGRTTGNPDFERIKNLINLCELTDQIILTGEVPSDKVPDLLINSDILVLSRPNNTQTQGGFPTKLGEYLITGLPVVVTNVGEISYYLEDKQNAFISREISPESFAEKLDEVASDYPAALKIGFNGKKTAIRNFHYENVVKVLTEGIKKKV